MNRRASYDLEILGEELTEEQFMVLRSLERGLQRSRL